MRFWSTPGLSEQNIYFTPFPVFEQVEMGRVHTVEVGSGLDNIYKQIWGSSCGCSNVQIKNRGYEPICVPLSPDYVGITLR